MFWKDCYLRSFTIWGWFRKMLARGDHPCETGGGVAPLVRPCRHPLGWSRQRFAELALLFARDREADAEAVARCQCHHAMFRIGGLFYHPGIERIGVTQ